MGVSKSKLRLKLESVLTEYIQKFEKKHGVKMEFAVADDLMGVISFGCVYYLSINDIIYDIDEGLKKGLIFEWVDYTLEHCSSEGENTINLRTFVNGFRKSKVVKYRNK